MTAVGRCRERTHQNSAPALSQLDSLQLVHLARQGNTGAWDALVLRYTALVWSVARSFGLNVADASDVCQTTWLRLVENLDRLREPERITGWLATTARREACRVLRLSSRYASVSSDVALSSATSGIDGRQGVPEERLTILDQHNAVASAVAQLPPRQRLVLSLLSSDSGLSYQEISDVLEIPIGSIGPTRARALEQLRRLCAEAGVAES